MCPWYRSAMLSGARSHMRTGWQPSITASSLTSSSSAPLVMGYLAYLGRISPEKGVDVAIRVASRTGLSLKVAARLPLRYHDDPNAQADRAYFNDVVRPLLDGPDVEFLGELGARDRDEFLGGAAALLFPISWPEPFGLVMAEALACGTPVLALRAVSVPEVVEHGLTGFICDDEDELVAAVHRLPQIDRAQCRTVVERRFSPAAMASAYEQVYARLLARPVTAPANGPRAVGRPQPVG
jgi:glycosyltransferase involved in cell wall biosynthesis